MFVSTCRSLRGNVDRNMKRDHIAQSRPDVVPYVGTWIEIQNVSKRLRRSMSFPTWERG